MKNIGLSKEDLEKIRRVFSHYKQIKKVLLYGSRAKGNYKNGSDIDITLIGDNITFQTLLDVESELEELFLPYKFDISIYNKIKNKDLINHIQRVGTVLFNSEKN